MKSWYLLTPLSRPIYCKPDFIDREFKFCDKMNVDSVVLLEGVPVQYPLSRDEQVAMTRYLSGIRKQLQDVSDLFTARYGKHSNIAEIAVKALVSSTLLEHEMMMLESFEDGQAEEIESARALTAAY